MITFDTLKLAKRLRDAGLPASQAEAIAEAEAEALGEFVTNNLATKGDISELKADIADLRGDIAEVKGEISQVHSELQADIAQVHSELKADITQVHSELKAEIAQVKSELKTEIAELRGEFGKIDARFERMDRKFTLLFMVLMFTIIILNQNALEFLARLIGLAR